MHILLTGATGLIGRTLTIDLLKKGHKLTVVGRSEAQRFRKKFSFPCDYYSWIDLKIAKLQPIDAVIHLAGESIATGRWTRDKKNRIYNSRVESTQQVCKFLIESNNIPKVFVSASGIGYYGDNKEEVTESAPKGDGFLSDVCKDWERASNSLEGRCRRVLMRLGVVLDHRGGFLEELEKIFRSGTGGVIGDGQQYLSWIHIKDVIAALNFVIDEPKISGPVNFSAPEPVTNQEWTELFSKTLQVPALFKAPKIALKILLGEKSDLALLSQNAKPAALQEAGYHFKFGQLGSALYDLYSWKKKATDRIFYASQYVEKDLETTFQFFSEAKNLEKITPPMLNFKIKKMSTQKIKKGTTIDYQLKIHGLPASWRTLITEWNPPHQFVDNQESGPYSQWHHTHSFEKLGTGTLMHDEVIYRLPMGFLGDVVANNFVTSDVNEIFAYRKECLGDYLG